MIELRCAQCGKMEAMNKDTLEAIGWKAYSINKSKATLLCPECKLEVKQLW